jgi:hypothetical protein
MAWEIELAEQVETWLLEELDDEGRRQIVPAIDELEATGPTLGRPFVDTIKASRHSNMKELRSIGGNLRILFAFDQDRKAILLIAGDKTGNWKPWYATNIPKADALFDSVRKERSDAGHQNQQVARRQKAGRKGRR